MKKNGTEKKAVEKKGQEKLPVDNSTKVNGTEKPKKESGAEKDKFGFRVGTSSSEAVAQLAAGKTKAEIVKYEIRGVFDQTFTGTVTPEGLDILDFKDTSSEHLEDLKVAVRAGGGEEKPKLSKSLSTKDRPHHDRQDRHSEDWRNDPQVEQWVA